VALWVVGGLGTRVRLALERKRVEFVSVAIRSEVRLLSIQLRSSSPEAWFGGRGLRVLRARE
jgi:hypothetical protein